MNNPNLVFAISKGLIVVILFPDNVNFTKESTFFVLNNIFDKNLILVKFCLSILPNFSDLNTLYKLILNLVSS